MKRTPLSKKGQSDTAKIKDEIQHLVREIVILRDGGCLFRNEPGHTCTGLTKYGDVILQADHLVTRANSATYADTRLIVCVCKGIHGWKSVGSNMRKAEYDRRVRLLISPDRVALWDRCEKESWRPQKMNWQVELAALRQEYQTLLRQVA